MNANETRCAIAVLTGFKLGIYHLIASGIITKIEQSENFRTSTESRLAKIHLELDHYINVLSETLYRSEKGIGEAPINPDI